MTADRGTWLPTTWLSGLVVAGSKAARSANMGTAVPKWHGVRLSPIQPRRLAPKASVRADATGDGAARHLVALVFSVPDDLAYPV